MKVKVFHIRLTKENLQTDQDNLNNFLDSVAVKKTATELINAQPNFWSILVFYDDNKIESKESSTDKISVTSESKLTTEEKSIYDVLRQWRHDKSNQINVPSYLVATNAELMTIAKLKPQNLADLSIVKGFSAYKMTKYGDDIIAVLNSV